MKNGTKPVLEADVDLDVIGKSEQCDGFTGADLAALVREAGIQSLKDYMLMNDQTKSLTISTDHFNRAVNKIISSVSEKVRCSYQNLFYAYLNKKTVRFVYF